MHGRCECYQCARTPVQLVRTDADNPDPRDARIAELEAEVARLKQERDAIQWLKDDHDIAHELAAGARAEGAVSMTRTERAVVLLSEGLTPAEVAAKMGITRAAVYSYKPGDVATVGLPVTGGTT